MLFTLSLKFVGSKGLSLVVGCSLVVVGIYNCHFHVTQCVPVVGLEGVVVWMP